MGKKIEELAIEVRIAEIDVAHTNNKHIDAKERLERLKGSLADAVDAELLQRREATD